MLNFKKLKKLENKKLENKKLENKKLENKKNRKQKYKENMNKNLDKNIIKKNYYEIIIIGSGISGLYFSYKLKQKNPNISFCILESNKKRYIGGRIGVENFHNVNVVSGAGVGRYKKDKLLIKLMKELNISYEIEKVQINYNFKPLNILQIIEYLEKCYKNEVKEKKECKENFKNFALKYLSKSTYDLFIKSAGYSDFEKADVYTTLFYYGWDDNISNWKKMKINWKELINKLVNFINIKNIKTSNKVVKIIENLDNNLINNINKINYIIKTEKGEYFFSNKIIIATRISTLTKLLPNYEIYNNIQGQSFLRLYVKLNKNSSSIVKNILTSPSFSSNKNDTKNIITYVSSPLQKIIPINLDKGIIMLSYSDNNNADFLESILNNNKNEKWKKNYLSELLEKELLLVCPFNPFFSEKGIIKIISFIKFYWKIGTHYYLTLNNNIYKNRIDYINKAQRPKENMFVIGELISEKNQGWTEGALESVENIFNNVV